MSHSHPRPDHHAGTSSVSVDQMSSLAEAADLYGVTKATVRRWIDGGHISGYKLPGSTMIRVSLAEIAASMTKVEPKVRPGAEVAA